MIDRSGIEGGAVYALSAALRDAIERDGGVKWAEVDETFMLRKLPACSSLARRSTERPQPAATCCRRASPPEERRAQGRPTGSSGARGRLRERANCARLACSAIARRGAPLRVRGRPP